MTFCDSRLCGDVLGTQGKGVTAKSGLCESHRQACSLNAGSRLLPRSPGGEAQESAFAASQSSHIQGREPVGQSLDRSRCGGEEPPEQKGRRL